MLTDKTTVLMIGWFFYPKTGGAETIMFNQARGLVKDGYRVIVLTSAVEGRKDQEDFEGMTIVRRNYYSSTTESPLEEVKQDFVCLLEKYSPAIIHFHNGSYPSGGDRDIGVKKVLAMFEVAKGENKIIIEHAHNAQLRDPEKTAPLRALNWDYLICVSNFVKEKWQGLGTAAKEITTIYNGIDIRHYKDVLPSQEVLKMKSSGKKIIFFPARITSSTKPGLNKQKNFRLVIDTCKTMLDKGIKDFKVLAIFNEVVSNENTKAGRENLFALLKEKGLKDFMIFIPAISPDLMPSYYAAVDIICVPSTDETFGLVYIEGMAAGRIVIASDTGGPREYIKNSENGFLVDPQNPIELAEILENLIKEKYDINSITLRAKKTAEGFSSEKMVEKIEEIYRSLLQRN